MSQSVNSSRTHYNNEKNCVDKKFKNKKNLVLKESLGNVERKTKKTFDSDEEHADENWLCIYCLNPHVELRSGEQWVQCTEYSFSALSSLKNISFHSPKVIQRLAAKIHIRKNLNQNIALLWIPGHSGVSWNEKADSTAKQVSDFSPYIDWIASEDILSHLKKQSFQITEENYHKSKYQLLIGNIPDILTISKWTDNQVQDRLIARIISKTITTPGLLYSFNLHPDPLCRVCNKINDISRILLKCQKYASVRVILWRKLNIVSANITYDVLLSHVFANKNHLLIFVQTLKYFDIV
ncbi:hypothetical protein AVEN_74805-1 [Araneus ventricosus]|uniref:RNase H type-1 domain-containing protein n=1 Tax=Araneus ventricosus TaxID=182803 RepID=A0A4Y2HP89_ARAVE|nr:hypothetical protein AVEN_74805-1 [Araneus ventricosus]